MPLLSEFTLSLLENEKVAVHFIDTKPSEYERGELLRFFKRYKKDVFVDFEGGSIFFIVTVWRYWVEFLISLGFKDTAKAVVEILNDLDRDRELSVDKFIENLRKAKPILVCERSVVEDRNKRDWEYLKEKEVERLTRKDEEKENNESDDEDVY